MSCTNIPPNQNKVCKHSAHRWFSLLWFLTDILSQILDFFYGSKFNHSNINYFDQIFYFELNSETLKLLIKQFYTVQFNNSLQQMKL